MKQEEFPLLSFDEEKDLATKAQNGDKKAYDKLVNANLRLVVNVAKRYSEESSSGYYTTVAVKSDGSYYDLNNIMPKQIQRIVESFLWKNNEKKCIIKLGEVL